MATTPSLSAALGLAALFKTHPWAFDVARTVGGCYLVWLGIKLLRSGPVSYDAAGQAVAERAGLGPALLSGVLTNVLNPKALLFCSVLLPQFVSPALGPIGPQFAVLGISFLVLEWFAIALYSWAGMYLGKWLVRRTVRRWFNRCCGGFLAAIGVGFLMVRRG